VLFLRPRRGQKLRGLGPPLELLEHQRAPPPQSGGALGQAPSGQAFCASIHLAHLFLSQPLRGTPKWLRGPLRCYFALWSGRGGPGMCQGPPKHAFDASMLYPDEVEEDIIGAESAIASVKANPKRAYRSNSCFNDGLREIPMINEPKTVPIPAPAPANPIAAAPPPIFLAASRSI